MRQASPVDTSGHLKPEFSGGYEPVFNFVSGNKPWSQRGSEVFRLSRAQPDLHLFLLNVPSAPIVHYRVSCDVGLGVLLRNVLSGSSDHARYFQFEIQRLRVRWIWN